MHAAAQAGAARAREYAEWAVRETGFGVAEHKVLKNLASSTGLVEAYAGHDYVTPRIDPVAKIVEIPRPAGVVLALTPSTNPVATVFVKALLALMTRSAVVVSPHPLARECSADAARALAAAAVAAGAPDGIIQVVDEPSVPLINALMADERTSVIVATGGTAVVRAAYSSGNPAIGVGPGNVPVLVDGTADLARAAQRIADSKSFDNSILCTNESVLIVTEAAAGTLLRNLQAGRLPPAGAGRPGQDPRPGVPRRALRHPVRRARTRPGSRSRPGSGCPARPGCCSPRSGWSCRRSRWPTRSSARCSAWSPCPARSQGIDAARAVLRIGGKGHSAAIHSTSPATIMAYGAALDVLRVAVNAGSSLGSAGIETGLAPSMTIGTGFFGRSSVGENLQPKHLVQWTRLAYNSDPAEAFGDFAGLDPWQVPAGPVPPYPLASNQAEHSLSRTPVPASRLCRMGRPARAGGRRAARGDPPRRAGGTARADRG